MPDTISIIPPKAGSKSAALVAALRGKGSTITRLSKKFTWQPHTVRAAITQLRGRGYIIDRNKSAGAVASTYRLKSSK